MNTYIIPDLKTEDTGLYTCTASSESGETSWSASLSVENPKNPNIIFHKTPDPATFPQAPTKVNNFGQNSLNHKLFIHFHDLFVLCSLTIRQIVHTA